MAPRVVSHSKRRWGYLVWVVMGGVLAVPEITAAKANRALPFTTISEMTGHLERRHTWVELLVVASIVLAVFSITRIRPSQSGAAGAGGAGPRRTVAGRLTLRAPPSAATAKTTKDFDDELAPTVFVVAAVLSLVVIGVATWAATYWWYDARHFHPAYVLYGLLFFLWLGVPSVVALVGGRDVPFPTLFRSVANLEEWLKKQTWPWTLGPVLGWLVSYVIVAGLVILLIHLTLYPYPDITHILNPGG